MDSANSHSLAEFAAAVQEYGYGNENEEPSTSNGASQATVPYAPADSHNTNPHQSYPVSVPNGSPNVQTRRQSNILRNTNGTAAVGTMRSPQQPRAVQAHTQASRKDSLVPVNSNSAAQLQPADIDQHQTDNVPSQRQNGFIFRNASSAFPNGTPTLPRSQSQSQVYTTSQGIIPTDPWTSHYRPSPSADGVNGTANGNENAEIDPAVAANPFSDTFPLISQPPNLEEWRAKLFNVNDTLTLSEEEFLTYFPHIDNVYSHRSTQKYKRKAFVSHYWDCRLKGRPSGTPKSEDPNKKKRKRTARERDLCDVKIKITEYFSAEEARKMGLEGNANGADVNFNTNDSLTNDMNGGVYGSADSSALNIVMEDGSQSLGGGLNGLGAGLGGSVALSNNNSTDPNFGLLELPRPLPQGHPGANGRRWFTVQRVRGNPGGGAVKDNNKRDSNANGEPEEDIDQSVLDPSLGGDLDHKHSLDESDRIKKNSVQRWMLKEEKEKKRMSVRSFSSKVVDLGGLLLFTQIPVSS